MRTPERRESARRPSRQTGTPAARPAAEAVRWCERFTQECRRRGIRVTPQRVAVFRAVVQDLSHPTPDAVHRRILARTGPMSAATVYRTLEFLVGAGLLRRVSTPESVSRFDANLTPHQHLICRRCGRMQDWNEASLHRVRLPRLAFPEFQAEVLDIRIVGICARCGRMESMESKTDHRRT